MLQGDQNSKRRRQDYEMINKLDEELKIQKHSKETQL